MTDINPEEFELLVDGVEDIIETLCMILQQINQTFYKLTKIKAKIDSQ